MRLYRAAVAWVERVATPRRMRVYALLMAASMLGGLAWNYARGSGLLDASGNVIGGDFLAFYTGARLFLAGQLAESYDAGVEFGFPAQMAFQRQVLAPQQFTGIHPFVNPPHAVLLYLPFAWQSYRIGLALWWIAGLAALAIAIALLRRELAPLRARPAWQSWIACWLFLPTYAWFGYGQATAWILLLYAGFFVLLRRGHDGWAGACLASLAFKPQLAFALVVPLVVHRRWRALAAGAACTGAWLVIGYALAPDATPAYLTLAPQLAGMLRVEGYPTQGIHSFLGFSAVLLDAFSVSAADVLTAALTVGALGWLSWRWWRTPWRPGAPGWDLLLAATFAIGLIASPQLYLYDLMLLLLPFAIVWCHSPRGAPLGGGAVLAWSAVVWLLAFLGTPLTLVQLRATSALGIGPFALQLATPAILAWGIEVVRLGERGLEPRGA